eukprot:gene18912-21514_t
MGNSKSSNFVVDDNPDRVVFYDTVDSSGT